MKQSKLLTSTLAAAALTASVGFTSAANAEVSASVGVASMYLWRGYDLSAGSAAVSGDISVSGGGDAFGAYAGMWTSSGDDGWGTEYDLYGGLNGSAGDFSWDVMYISYVYPNTEALGNQDVDIGDFSEVIVSLGYGAFGFSYFTNVGDTSPSGTVDSYNYLTLSASVSSFSFLLGQHDDDSGDKPTHFDATYSYNDNLSFTFSKWISDEPADDDHHFVVSYSIPIE